MKEQVEKSPNPEQTKNFRREAVDFLLGVKYASISDPWIPYIISKDSLGNDVTVLFHGSVSLFDERAQRANGDLFEFSLADERGKVSSDSLLLFHRAFGGQTFYDIAAVDTKSSKKGFLKVNNMFGPDNYQYLAGIKDGVGQMKGTVDFWFNVIEFRSSYVLSDVTGYCANLDDKRPLLARYANAKIWMRTKDESISTSEREFWRSVFDKNMRLDLLFAAICGGDKRGKTIQDLHYLHREFDSFSLVKPCIIGRIIDWANENPEYAPLVMHVLFNSIPAVEIPGVIEQYSIPQNLIQDDLKERLRYDFLDAKRQLQKGQVVTRDFWVEMVKYSSLPLSLTGGLVWLLNRATTFPGLYSILPVSMVLGLYYFSHLIPYLQGRDLGQRQVAYDIQKKLREFTGE